MRHVLPASRLNASCHKADFAKDKKLYFFHLWPRALTFPIVLGQSTACLYFDVNDTPTSPMEGRLVLSYLQPLQNSA